MTFTYERFIEKWRTIHNLREVQELVDWDQQVMMPPLGTEQKGFQQAALAGVVHSMLTDPGMGELIEELSLRGDLDLYQTANLRDAKREWEKETKIPARLVEERAHAVALAQGSWLEARKNNDFSAFAPFLEKVVAITREMAEAVGGGNPYDVLIDDFEPGMTENVLKGVFSALKGRLVGLNDKIEGGSHPPTQEPVTRFFPREKQEAFCVFLAKEMGYDFNAGRLDVSAHPFTSGTRRDVRITTRYDERFLNTALFGVMHEAGHALYEQGLDPDRYRDPSGQACSLGIHESQSRLWENLIGRSRAFWVHYYPELKRFFPGVLDDVDLDTFYGAINVSRPSLIRVEADEATYNLHIIMRFEIESDLMAGRLKVGDLPAAWNAKSRELLGIEPEEDANGVLQDVHWSAGLIGYFPTYALGNLFSAQFMEAARRDLPDIEERLEKGDLISLRKWLGENIHFYGRLYLAEDLCEKVTGKKPSGDALMSSLEGKYSEIYGF